MLFDLWGKCKNTYLPGKDDTVTTPKVFYNFGYQASSLGNRASRA